MTASSWLGINLLLTSLPRSQTQTAQADSV
jgi:hypothetical protein